MTKTKKRAPSPKQEPKTTTDVASDHSPLSSTTHSESPPPPSTPPSHPPQPSPPPPPTTEIPSSVTDTFLSYPALAPLETVERIDGALALQDNHAPRYSFLSLPPNLKWGTKALGRRIDIDEFLCFNNNIATLWIVGKIHFLQLLPSDDEHIATIKPLSSQLLALCRTLQHTRAQPPTPYPKNQLVYFSANNNQRAPFKEIYDATDHLLPWTNMQDDKIDVDDLQLGDTILIELYVHRHKLEPTHNRLWTTWSVSFDLVRIAAISRVPAPVTLPPDSEINL